MTGIFRSLSERNYRLYASGQVVSLTGTWMQRAAQDWLVLELSGGSPAALGLAIALQFLPSLFITPWAGVLADRFDKRVLLLVVQAAMGVCGLALGVLDVSGFVQLWHVYLLCVILGCFASADGPVRQSFAVEMVGPASLTNAVALNSMTFNLARIIGPALSGLLITQIGTGWVFVINGFSSAAVIAGLLLMDPAQLYRKRPSGRPEADQGALAQMKAGLQYVRRSPRLMVVMPLVLCIGTFGMNFESAFAVMARNVFHRDADGYGLLITILAIGTLAGATLAARRSDRARPPLRLVVIGAGTCGATQMLASVMPTYWLFAAALIPVGITSMTFTTSANSTTQLSVDPDMRGRVMGLYMLLFFGGKPIGGLFSGWLAELFGGRAPLLVGGGICLIVALTCAFLARRAQRIAAGSPG